jgi:hypothetical protein
MYTGFINERTTMKDTRNHYIIQMEDGYTFEADTPLEDDQSAFFIDNYYKGRISRLWINGVEWKEPTE